MKIRFNKLIQGKELEPFVYNEAPVYCDCHWGEHFVSPIRYKMEELREFELGKITGTFFHAGFTIKQTLKDTLMIWGDDELNLILDVGYTSFTNRTETRGFIEKKGFFKSRQLPITVEVPSSVKVYGEIEYIGNKSDEEIDTKPVTDVLKTQLYQFSIITPNQELLEELRDQNYQIKRLTRKVANINSEAEVWY